MAVFDIGPKTTTLFKRQLKSAKTVFWNGPVGVFEIKPYDTQTKSLAKYLGKIDAFTIIGGGDTATAINKVGSQEDVNFISTGGGAALQFIEKPLLPAFSAIVKSQTKK
jgi:phosphoglycerate kinase